MLWLAIAILVCVAAFLIGRVSERRRADAILPPAVVNAVDQERADRARVDSQLIAASLEAVAAQQRQAEANARAEAIRRSVAKLSLFADSIARRAERAANAVDSAALYRDAYMVRTDERDSLLMALEAKDSALTAAEDRARALTRVAAVADAARQRADSVLDAVVDAAHQAECRVPLTFGLVRCMSRGKAALLGVVIGVAGTVAYDAIRDGRLSIPLRLP